MELLSLPTSAQVSDLDAMEARLRVGGWADKPAPMSDLDADDRAMAEKLLHWEPPASKLIVDRYEWFWTANTLGRRWYLVRRTYGIGTVHCSGFDEAGLKRAIQACRSSGLKIVEVAAPSVRA